jgi:hypothetical protein
MSAILFVTADGERLRKIAAIALLASLNTWVQSLPGRITQASLYYSSKTGIKHTWIVDINSIENIVELIVERLDNDQDVVQIDVGNNLWTKIIATKKYRLRNQLDGTQTINEF